MGTFAALAYLGSPRREVNDVDELAGLARSQPLVAGAIAVFMFSLAGLPPLAGFWGKLKLFGSAIQLATSGAGRLVALVHRPGRRRALNAAIAAAYYLRIVAVMYFQPADAAGGGRGRTNRPLGGACSVRSWSSASAPCPAGCFRHRRSIRKRAAAGNRGPVQTPRAADRGRAPPRRSRGERTIMTAGVVLRIRLRSPPLMPRPLSPGRLLLRMLEEAATPLYVLDAAAADRVCQPVAGRLARRRCRAARRPAVRLRRAAATSRWPRPPPRSARRRKRLPATSDRRLGQPAGRAASGRLSSGAARFLRLSGKSARAADCSWSSFSRRTSAGEPGQRTRRHARAAARLLAKLRGAAWQAVSHQPAWSARARRCRGAASRSALAAAGPRRGC